MPRFLNAVPEYYWKTTEIGVNVDERAPSVQLDVSIIQSSLTDFEFCTSACPCANFTLLNDSKFIRALVSLSIHRGSHDLRCFDFLQDIKDIRMYSTVFEHFQ